MGESTGGEIYDIEIESENRVLLKVYNNQGFDSYNPRYGEISIAINDDSISLTDTAYNYTYTYHRKSPDKDWVYYGDNVTVRQIADNPRTVPINDYSGANYYSGGVNYYLNTNGNVFVTTGGTQYAFDMSNDNLYINGIFDSSYDFEAPPPMSQTAGRNYTCEHDAIIIARHSGLDVSTVWDILYGLYDEIRLSDYQQYDQYG
ncbi:hypothetical protein FACS1894120_3980 [Clostridia bacterium]|nr:hypothetical protein FACS1894120_3980 [Clostridia bacterium]